MYKGEIRYAKIPNIPDYCRRVNHDLTSYNFNDVKKDIDYMFYVQRCADLLDIPWVQLEGIKLFNTDRFNYFK